jgi:hypothetical protein
MQAVLLHVQAAFGHLTRGQTTSDEAAFTDVIYRCNQAFEGSIKEAFRVLASKDPVGKNISEIEKYLQNNKIFKDGVLTYFTRYRQDWRNPSTHDYWLNFDQNEAFLAIVSVCAFACILTDQIAARLCFLSAQIEAEQERESHQLNLPSASEDFLYGIATSIEAFLKGRHLASVPNMPTEERLIAGIAGFLSVAYPDIISKQEILLSGPERLRPDLILSLNDKAVVVEVKYRRASDQLQKRALERLERYMFTTKIDSGLLLIYGGYGEEVPYARTEHQPGSDIGRILVLAPRERGSQV